jgi:tetratricopeptide (TPR) repeat protein
VRRTKSTRTGPIGTVVPWAAFLAVGALTFLVFLPSLSNGFVKWDDEPNFVENEHYRGLSLENLEWMFTRFHTGHWHPLTWITFGFDYVVWGMNPLGYHLTNIVLHALAAALFARLAAWMFELRDFVPESRDGKVEPLPALQSRSVWFGVLVGLAWSLHPLRVEAATWITQRREVLCGVFTLLALTGYLRNRSPWLIGFLTVCAMLSKVTGIMIPALLVLVDVYRAGRHEAGAWRHAFVISIARHMHLIVMAGGVLLAALFAQREASALVSTDALPIPSRIALYFFGIVFCVTKTFWPAGLAPLHQGQTSMSTWSLEPFVWWTALAGLLFAIVMLAIGIRKRKESFAWITLTLAFLLLAAPAGGLGQSGPQIAGERYTYQPGWVLTLGVGALIASFTSWPSRWWKELRYLVPTLAVLGTLDCLTIRQQAFWRDTETLWARELDVYPENPVGNYNLAVFYYKQKPPDLERAEAYYKKALERDPTYTEALSGYGFLLRSTGRPREAYELFKKIVESKHAKMTSQALSLGGSLLWDFGKTDEAIAMYSRLVAGDPKNPEAYRQLGKVQAAAGRPREAIATLERGIAAAPDAALYGELAWLLATHPDPDVRDGARALQLAKQVAPREKRGLRTVTLFAAASAEAGQYEEGRQEVEAALARMPEHSPALQKLLADLASRQPVRVEPKFP